MIGKLVTYSKIGVIGLIGILLAACENDSKQLNKLSAQQGKQNIDRTTGVDAIFSDSARVKMHLVTPLMLDYKLANPYTVMPRGVKGTFYDDSLRVTSTIVADSAIRREREQRIELYKNVVATNDKGDIFRSDELTYNMITHKVTSKKPVTITTVTGNVIHGDALETNEKFSPWTIPNTNGKLVVQENLSQQ